MTRLLFVSASALALAACAGKTPPPAIHYDAADFRAAVEEAEPAKPIEIVETPVPLPLPGQLQPPPSVKPEDGHPTADRKSGVKGTRWSVRGAHGGRRIINKKNT